MSELKIIKKFLSYLNDGKDTSKYESVISDSIDKFANLDEFYSLPSNIILKIVGQCESLTPTICQTLASHLPDKQLELLKVISLPEETTFEDLSKSISAFSEIPILMLYAEKSSEVSTSVEKDYQYYYNEEKKKNEINKEIIEINSNITKFIGKVNEALKNGWYEKDFSRKLGLLINSVFDFYSSGISNDIIVVREFYQTLINEHKNITGLEMPPKPKENTISFDQAMHQLETILNKLSDEADNLSSFEVEELIQQAENLRNICKSHLTSERSNIIKTAKDNNIPLRDIGIIDEDDEEEEEVDDDEEEEEEEDDDDDE